MSDSEYLRQLETIIAKVEAGERISFEEGLFLDEKVDVLTLGRLANIIRERKNGNLTYYNTNVHLNPTNVCVYRCTFCAFRADLHAEKFPRRLLGQSSIRQHCRWPMWGVPAVCIPAWQPTCRPFRRFE